MEYLFTHFDKVKVLFLQHLILTYFSVFIALIIAVPVSLVAVKNNMVKKFIINGFNIIYTIPSIAFLSILVPYFGLGFKSSLIALVFYAQMILVRNITAAIDNIKPEIVEAAKGMGMSRWQRMYKIKVPIAMPVIFAGIRITTITLISLASVAAFINGGGLGEIILEGIRTDNSGKIIAGAVAMIVLMVINEGGNKICEYIINKCTHKS